MKKIIDYFIQRSFVVNLISGFLILAGIVTVSSMQRDLIPPFQWEKVSVRVVINGASPQEMEKYVTFPVEEATQGMRGVERVESVSKAGVSEIDYYFASDFDDMDQASEIVSTRLSSIRSQLPDSIRQMTVERAQVNSVFLFWLGLENFDEKDPEHRLFVDKLTRSLRDISGIVKVSQGYRKRDISIQFDTQKLKKYEISLNQARSVINESLTMAPIGMARVGSDDYSVKLERTTRSLDDLRMLPLRSSRLGNTVFLKDVAQVDWRLEDQVVQRFVNGKPGAYLSVRKDIHSDMLDVKPKVLEVIEEYNKTAPDNLVVKDLVNGPHFLEQQLDVLFKNGIVGLVLVLLILMAFLNFKTALMTGLGLPLAYSGAMIVLYLFGVNIDLLSIIGMILVIGVLVDDAIIVSERYCDYLENGEKPQQAASKAVQDLLIPVSGTVLTTIVAFAPMIFIKSGLSKILFAVPLVVIAALVLSWIESFFILPNHLSHFVKKSRKVSHSPFRRVQRGYEAFLSQFLRFRYPSLLLLGGILALAGWLGMNRVDHNFDLNINSERVSIYAVLKESDSYKETMQAIAPVEDFLQSFPDGHVENTYTSVGQIWMNGRIHEGFKYAKIQAYINRDAKYPSEIKNKIQNEVNEKLKELKTEGFSKLYSEIEKQESKEKKKQMVSLEIRGEDRVQFSDIESDISKRVVKLESIEEYSPDPNRFQKSWIFHPDNQKLAQYGLSPISVSQQIRGAFAPHLVKEARLQGDSVNVYMELDKERELSFKELGEIEVLSSQDLGVPLKFLGEWRNEKALKKINHYDGSRNLVMDFLVTDESNTTAAQSELETLAKDLRKNYPSYEMKVLNASEREAQSQAWALKVATICIVGVLLIISLILGSLTQPFLVGLPIPFALAGIVFALYLNGLPLGVMALVGLVGCIGVSVNASLVMVVEMNKRAHGSHLSRQDIIHGASSRFRAILLTTLTTLGGVFPMAYSWGGESGFTQPLAFALGWGLTFSTLATLFFIPALMNIREDLFSLLRRLWRKLSPKPKPFEGDSSEKHEDKPHEPVEDSDRWVPGVVTSGQSEDVQERPVQ